MKISVVIPHYNQHEYLNKAIGSVLDQTYKPYEIIIVDDCSITPLSGEYAANVIFQRTENGGIGAVRADGLMCATGDYIAFLSADDLWAPTFLEECAKELEKCEAVYTDYYNIDAAGNIKDHFKEAVLNNREDFCVQAWLRCNVMFSGLVVSKRICDMVGYEPSLRFGEDYLFLLKAMKHMDFAHIQKPLAYYRRHDKQTTITKQLEIFENDKKIRRMALDYWDKFPNRFLEE